MHVLVYSSRPHDREVLEPALVAAGHQISHTEATLDELNLALAQGCDAICTFVNDELDAARLQRLADMRVRLILQRAAGIDNIDLDAARRSGIAVAHAPAYSPHAVAEHAVALLLSLNRHVHIAWQRVQQGNFLLDGLLGFDLHGKTAGIVGMGRIGQCFARIMLGFGCRVLAFDPGIPEDARMPGVEYDTLDAIWHASDILSLHCPLLPATRHLVDARLLTQSRPHALLINTSRGAVVDTRAVLDALSAGRLGGYAADVYESERNVFFHDCSGKELGDALLCDLIRHPNVLVTPHQAFFTREALQGIARAMVDSLAHWAAGTPGTGFVTARP